jgi:hypothetical protein
VVDSKSLVPTEIPGMLPAISATAFGVAMRCVARDYGNVVLVGFVIEDTWSFAYYERGIQPDNHLLNEILPRCKFINTLPT